MVQSVIRLEDLDIAGKRLLIREDLNVPIKEGVITSDARIRAALPTLEMALARGARLVVMSHLGRPKEGVPIAEQQEVSLGPVAARLAELLGRPVPLIEEWRTGGDWEREPIVLLENVRTLPGEGANDEGLARRYAGLCDIFVMDAFATAHRAQASTHRVAEFAPVACAGPLLARELDALERATANPERPVIAIVGGAKVSTKLELLGNLAQKVERLIVGGGIANTFLAAAGYEIGVSLYEQELIESARALMDKVEIPLPVDVVVAKEISATAEGVTKPVAEVAADEMIVDVGPQTSEQFAAILGEAKTVIWNGPLGVFEQDQFGAGTRSLSMALANSAAFTLAGGGETVAAIDKYGVREKISYISTAGGAFLEYVEGKTLPAVAVLQARAGKE